MRFEPTGPTAGGGMLVESHIGVRGSCELFNKSKLSRRNPLLYSFWGEKAQETFNRTMQQEVGSGLSLQ